jgi:sugar phosphate isomerase/epimerase
MKFSVCNEIYGDMPWPEVCAIARASGFEGIEIASIAFAPSVRDISAERRREIRQVALDAGLTICALHMLMSPPSMGLYINHPDAAERVRAVDYLCAVFDFAADLEAPVLVYGSPFTRNIHPSLRYGDARRLMKESLLSCLDQALAQGLTLCIEPLPADCTDLCTTVEAAYGFVQEVGHPAFGLMMDLKQTTTEVRPVEKTVRLFGPYARHIHANDASGRAPGFGDVDFAPALSALQDIGYDGWVSLEPFSYRPDAASVAAFSLRYLKSCLAAEAQPAS